MSFLREHLLQAGRIGGVLALLGVALQPLGHTFAEAGHAPSQIHVSTAHLVSLRLMNRAAQNMANGQTQELPFFHPGGQAVLDQAKADAARSAPATGIENAIESVTGASPPSLLGGFEAVKYTDTTCGCEPPDGALAAGPTDLIAGANTAFKIVSTSGKLLSGPTEYKSFFSGAGCKTQFSDPQADYDNATHHFIMEVLTYSSTYASSICIAASQTADPTKAWYKYSIPVAGNNDLLDQPRIAIGTDAIYLSGNQFRQGQTYAGPRVYAINKTELESGQPLTSVYQNIGSASIYDSLNPARTIGTSAAPYVEPGYFLAADDTACPPTCKNVYEWKWTSPFNASPVVFMGSVPITPFAQPVSAKQKPSGRVDTNDSRDLAAVLYNGTIYGTHAISCRPNVTTVDCVQWYQIGNIDTVPTLIQQGIIGADNQYRFFPSLSVDKSGDMGIAYAYSSLSDFIGINYTGRLRSDPPGTVGTESVLKAGQAHDSSASQRWGDYAAEPVAPNGCAIYHLEEYAPSNASSDIWSTWTGKLQFAGC